MGAFDDNSLSTNVCLDLQAHEKAMHELKVKRHSGHCEMR